MTLVAGDRRRRRAACSGFAMALATLTSISAVTSFAQPYPSRPIRIIVPFAPGGPNDILARAVGMKLSESLGQQVLTDNRPGGGTVIGTELVARAPADGYTLLMASTSHTVNPTLRRSLPFDQLRDFTYVILMAKGAQSARGSSLRAGEIGEGPHRAGARQAR